MKKLILSLLLLSFVSCGTNDIHKIHDSTVETTPVAKPRHSYDSEWHICFYQNAEIVQEYDTVTDINTEGSYVNFKYHGIKHRVYMDYIAEQY